MRAGLSLRGCGEWLLGPASQDRHFVKIFVKNFVKNFCKTSAISNAKHTPTAIMMQMQHKL